MIKISDVVKNICMNLIKIFYKVAITLKPQTTFDFTVECGKGGQCRGAMW